MKYLLGDIIEFEGKEYSIQGIDKQQYSLYDKSTSVARSKKYWKVDKEAIPVKLVERPKQPSKKVIKEVPEVITEITFNTEEKPSIWTKLKFWS